MPDPASPNWTRVQELFLEAVELPEPDQPAFLDAQCAGNPSLRADVEALLRADRGRITQFGEIIQHQARAVLGHSAAELRIPERIGPYRLIRELGSGGMGSVHLAERVDGDFQQQVAIKLVRRDIATRETLARFRLERQILARLNHPNISRFLDGGITPEGQSYFVMEYIQGLPLDAWCDQQKLTAAARLGLFREVCAAVQYSHQNLIVHRDIKLSNILVTPDGTPKLLDFGVAKLLPAEGEGPHFTKSVAAAFTPEFASPEQITGDSITTASDIYSLGVVLYRLLTGKSPYSVSPTNIVEMASAITGEDPPPPSLAAQNRQFKGDIDNIVLTALRKDPHRRYPSVEALAEDVRRYQQGLPITARPLTLRYRISKFVHRNRVAVAAAAIAFVALCGFLVQAQLQNQRLARERDKAARVADFLSELFREASPDRNGGKELTARQILDRGANSIAQKGLANDPELLGKISYIIGRTYHDLGIEPQAIDWYNKSIAAFRTAGMQDTVDGVSSMNWLVSSLLWAGRNKEAIPVAREAVAGSRRIRGKRDMVSASALSNLCAALRFNALFDEAKPVCREQLELAKRLYPPLDTNLSVAYANMAGIQNATDDPEAVESFRAALAIKRQVLAPRHAQLIPSIGSLSTVLRVRDQAEEAAKLAEEALSISRELYPSGHKNLESALANVAHCYAETGRFHEAEALFQESLAIVRTLLPGHTDHVTTLSGLATLRHRTGDLAGAERYLHEALSFRKDPATAGNATLQLTYSLILADQGDLAAAESRLRAARATYERVLRPGNISVPYANIYLAAILLDRGGATAEAAELQAAAEKRFAAYVVPTGWRMAFVKAVRGAVLVQQGKPAEGRPLLDAAYPVIVQRLGVKDFRTRWVDRRRNRTTN